MELPNKRLLLLLNKVVFVVFVVFVVIIVVSQRKAKICTNFMTHVHNHCSLLSLPLPILSKHTPYSKMAAILVFFCFLENEPLLPRLRENILLNFN